MGITSEGERTSGKKGNAGRIASLVGRIAAQLHTVARLPVLHRLSILSTRDGKSMKTKQKPSS
jgi:hypothetical protein